MLKNKVYRIWFTKSICQQLSVAVLLLCLPSFAWATGETPVSDGLQYLTQALFGETGITLATLTVAGVGILCAAHVLEWKRLVQTVMGISILFGAGAIVASIQSLAGGL